MRMALVNFWCSWYVNIDSLEINEVYDMFQQNGININEDTLKKLFSIVDKRNTGALDLDNFKKFAVSEEANHCTSACDNRM